MNQLTISEASVFLEAGATVIDTRPSAIFVQGFIPGSVHMPLTDHFKEYVELVLDPEYTILVIAESGQEENACRALIKTGNANVVGYLDGGYAAWVDSGGQSDLIIDIDTEEFGIDYKFDEFYLIDTRSDEEYEAEHIEYAESIPLMDIEENVSVLAPTASYYIYGASFEDAAFAASLMKRNDFHVLRVVNNGYDALKSAEIPVVKRKKAKTDPKFSDN